MNLLQIDNLFLINSGFLINHGYHVLRCVGSGAAIVRKPCFALNRGSRREHQIRLNAVGGVSMHRANKLEWVWIWLEVLGGKKFG